MPVRHPSGDIKLDKWIYKFWDLWRGWYRLEHHGHIDEFKPWSWWDYQQECINSEVYSLCSSGVVQLLEVEQRKMAGPRRLRKRSCWNQESKMESLTETCVYAQTHREKERERGRLPILKAAERLRDWVSCKHEGDHCGCCSFWQEPSLWDAASEVDLESMRESVWVRDGDGDAKANSIFHWS